MFEQITNESLHTISIDIQLRFLSINIINLVNAICDKTLLHFSLVDRIRFFPPIFWTTYQ